VDFIPHDHSLLHETRALPALLQLAAPQQQQQYSEEEQTLRRLAAVVSRFLMTQAAAAEITLVDKKTGKEVPRFNAFQSFIADYVRGELEKSVQTLISLREELLASGVSDVTLEQNGPASQLASRFLRHEEGAFRQLCLLAAVANSRAVLAFLSQPPLLSTLCLCVKAGTPRMQRVCLRLLSLVLSTSVSPQYAEASGACTVLQQRRKHDQLVRGDLALEGDEKEEPEKAFRRLPGGRLIEALFLTLGSCLASQANDKDVVPPGRLPSPASAETKEGKEGKGENKSPRSSGSTAAASVEALARSNAANPFDQR